MIENQTEKENIQGEFGQGEVNLNVYPNPFGDYLTMRIDSPEEELFDVSIPDLNGRKVFETTEVPSNTDVTIDPQLRSGMYILMVNNKERRLIQRIIRK